MEQYVTTIVLDRKLWRDLEKEHVKRYINKMEKLRGCIIAIAEKVLQIQFEESHKGWITNDINYPNNSREKGILEFANTESIKSIKN